MDEGAAIQQQQQQANESATNEHQQQQQQQQATDSKEQQATSSSSSLLNSNNSKNKTTKLNGLKNRILQRPPPLDLNKVSNLYDVSESPVAQAQANSDSNGTEPTQQQAHQSASANNATNNSANQKFWASLNRNAAASRTQSNGADGGSQRETTAKESVSCASSNALGPDLIITHRNGSTNSLSTSRTLSSSSTLSMQQKLPPPHHSQYHHHHDHRQRHQSFDEDLENETNQHHQHQHHHQKQQQQPHHGQESGLENKSYELSNTSTEILDDSSTHDGAPSESAGGNLIGVDQSCTPPADSSGGGIISLNAMGDNGHNNLDIHKHSQSRGNSIDEQQQHPASANSSSSRSRSTNPFLAMEEEFTPPSPVELTHNNFHKRPASFIAATGSAIMKRQAALLNSSFPANNGGTSHNNGYEAPPDSIQIDTNTTTITSQMIQERSSNISLSDNMHHHHHQQQQQEQQHSGYQQQQQRQHHDQHYHHNSIYHHQQMKSKDLRDDGDHQHRMPIIMDQQHSMNEIYGRRNNYGHNGEAGISADSESAVCKPPPSATLPHWIDAIYELNNAILETNSVGGGAENGAFIHIVENGDIILELDQIKVSGFTLSEFNELVESKPVHLLRAVQTRHSQGLTTDLRQYLNSSFPKGSADKELQDLIRENIYRRTIPCTTRPPKDGEVDKVDYHFLTRDHFVEMNARGMLLECGMFNGHYYGTIKPYSDLNSLLSIYGTVKRGDLSSEMMQQPMNPSHPAIGSAADSSSSLEPAAASFGQANTSLGVNMMMGTLYEESPFKMNHHHHQQQALNQAIVQSVRPPPPLAVSETNHVPDLKSSSIVAVDSEALPPGWERVIDQTHGTYYIDHNTQRTQYERPYEIELTKGGMGFGFTLVEAENGVLLVRGIIPGGPAHLNGMMRPGDILVSAVGVSVSGLQHTDVAKLFSTFAVGDRVRMTFARGTYVVDNNLVPDEYLFSNGTNGDLAVAVNPNTTRYFNHNMISQSPQAHANQDYDFITVVLKRGDQGFGFTISDSEAGQRVRKIQNNDTCANLKQGDILICLNGQDITRLTHKQVVERLKNCPPGQDVTLMIKRKRRFRSKTPMALPTGSGGEYALESAPQRNCKTPSLDCLMMRRPAIQTSSRPASMYSSQVAPQVPPRTVASEAHQNMYHSLPRANANQLQSIYGTTTTTAAQDLYCNQPQPVSMPTYGTYFEGNSNYEQQQQQQHQTPSASNSFAGGRYDTMSNSVHASDAALTPVSVANISSLSQINQYNNFMNNDKLMMMQMQQPNLMAPAPVVSNVSHDYGYMPLYSNSEMIQSEAPMLPMRPLDAYLPDQTYAGNHQNNYYANTEEIALQRLQYAQANQHALPFDQHDSLYHYQQHQHHQSQHQQQSHQIYHQHHHQDDYQSQQQQQQQQQPEEEEYEHHQIDLDKGSTDLNWGIRLIGGSEVGRAISIGSIVFGGAASKNGKLKSGDEIISIDGINVVGATHQHVVELISGCTSKASLVVRRKKYAEACEVILTRNIDEGFGFVIISNENAALIGRIIQGSPADRCQQLHVRDQIVAVNGRPITANMKHPEIVNMIKGCGSTLRLRVIPADCYTVELIKSAHNDNFGFSMRGGNEYDGTPLYILRVASNGLARDLLNVGDQIIEINGIPTAGMTHAQAATIIKKSDPIVKLKLRRSEQIPPSLLVDSPRALQKFNQVTAEVKAVSTIVQNAPPPPPTPASTSTKAAAAAAQMAGDSSGQQSDNSASYEQPGGTAASQQAQLIQQQQQQLQSSQHQVASSNHLVHSRGLPLFAS